MQFTSDMHALPDYLYFADANLGLMIVDVSSPLVPVTASVKATGLMSPFGVQVAGDTAYVLDDQGLHVIDVTDRGDPTELERIPLLVNLTVLDARGDLVVGGGGPVDEPIQRFPRLLGCPPFHSAPRVQDLRVDGADK